MYIGAGSALNCNYSQLSMYHFLIARVVYYGINVNVWR
jgi:hypothetical protein